MGIETMGKVPVTARIENLQDLLNVQSGLLTRDKIRAVEVDDALVDTGATSLGMPSKLIVQLGLQAFRTQQVRTSIGPATVNVYQAVRLTIQGRDANFDVMEVPDDCPVLIGQVPLEMLDFVVDPQGRRLVGNPAHGGEHMLHQF
jgi:predicted aspartyl protease